MKAVLESIDTPEGGVNLAALFDEYSAEIQEHLWIYAFQPEVTEAELEQWSTIDDDVPIRIIRRAQDKIDADDAEYDNLITVVKDELARRQAADNNSTTGAASDGSVHAASDAEQNDSDEEHVDEAADEPEQINAGDDEQVDAGDDEQINAGDDEQMIDDGLDQLDSDENEDDEQQNEQDEQVVEGEEMVVDNNT